MVRRMMGFLMLFCLLWMSGCATDYSSSGSYDDGPSYPFAQRDMCNMSAVYCGPGP